MAKFMTEVDSSDTATILLLLSIVITMMFGMSWKFLTKSKLTYLRNINASSVKMF